jgi:hypothetical protein
VLSAAEAPGDLRTTITAALIEGNASAIDELVPLLARADPATMRLLSDITQQVVGLKNEGLALGLLEQLRQVAGSGN